MTLPEMSPETMNEVIVDQMSLIPGLTKELVLQSVVERRFDHISAIYDLLTTCPEDDSRNQSAVPLSAQRKASITTGVVERQDALPEIQLFLNEAHIYEKVNGKRNDVFPLHSALKLIFLI
jgi:serine/threonine-protein kinase SIK3